MIKCLLTIRLLKQCGKFELSMCKIWYKAMRTPVQLFTMSVELIQRIHAFLKDLQNLKIQIEFYKAKKEVFDKFECLKI